MPLLFKVLVGGKSAHRPLFDWSLPKDGQPGEWHEHQGELVKCQSGLHVTDDPAQWWKPECVVYVCKADGIQGTLEDDADRKVVCRRVRLLREATKAELEGVRIFLDGQHTVTEGKAIASGSARVEASGSASVEASGSARVEASGSARVEASGSASVEAWGSARVVAWGSARVEASGSASVEAWGSARVVASGSARVEARDSASVEADHQVTVVSWRGSEAVKLAGRAVCIVRVYDESTPPKVLTAQAEKPKKKRAKRAA